MVDCAIMSDSTANLNRIEHLAKFSQSDFED